METQNSFSVDVILRRHKKDKTTGSLYARITVNGGKPTEASLKQSLPVSQWHYKAEKVKGSSPLAKRINDYIENERITILEKYKELVRKRLPVTAIRVKQSYVGDLVTDKDHYRTLMELVRYHEEKNPNGLVPGSMKNYNATKTYIANFLMARFHLEDYYLVELNYEFLVDLEHHIRTKPIKAHDPCEGNGVAKHIERVKGLILFAKRKLKWIKEDPFEDYTVKKKKTKAPKLHIDELMAIESKQFYDPVVALVKDLFLFSCYTGLCYADTMKFSVSDFYVSNDGRKWLTTYRQKSDEFSPVPLLDTPAKLIEKYRNDPRSIATGTIFPPITNQAVNRSLKIIRAACEIAKNITFHTARHTFGTTVTLKNRVPVTSVQQMMGHAKIETTMGYTGVDEELLEENMIEAQEIFDKRKKARMTLLAEKKHKVMLTK